MHPASTLEVDWLNWQRFFSSNVQLDLSLFRIITFMCMHAMRCWYGCVRVHFMLIDTIGLLNG